MIQKSKKNDKFNRPYQKTGDTVCVME